MWGGADKAFVGLWNIQRLLRKSRNAKADIDSATITPGLSTSVEELKRKIKVHKEPGGGATRLVECGFRNSLGLAHLSIFFGASESGFSSVCGCLWLVHEIASAGSANYRMPIFPHDADRSNINKVFTAVVIRASINNYGIRRQSSSG